MKQWRWKRVLIILFWLSVWHILALWVDNKILLATPFQTLLALFGLLPKVSFWQAVAGSLGRIGLGFLSGTVTAVLLAIFSYAVPFVEEMLSPVMSLFRSMPVASFAVIFLIWWGSSFLAVAVSFLVVLPNIYVNVLEGLKNTDKRLLEMAQVFGIPFKNRFYYIYVPALNPFLMAGLKLAMGMAVRSGVAAEVIGTPLHSIGEGLYLSKIYLETANVFAWTAVVILLGCVLERLTLYLAQRFFDWQPKCAARSARKKTAQETAQKATRLLCKNLFKSYGGLSVVRDRTATYESGQIYYLTTPSGSGKTTFLRLLCGLEELDEGEIEGVKQFSVVFQEDRLCEDHSAVRNVELVTGPSARVRESLLQLLPREALDKPCGQLSGGMKRRVALVRAMEADSECVLLDEPFTGMDAGTKARAERYIKERQKGRILIIATHL
ncbi:MAG: ATP-binding cassette domain-containing protein [Candidatus Gastranaerophilales bacterium]|nr:ATP-binding cassette domain-containing protein [Candidatus Gastranaerophilales bacterium]